MGFDSEVNVGWIKLGTKTRDEPAQVATSVFKEAHTEERLIAWARGWRDTAGRPVNFALAPDAEGEEPRVKALYTERQPCTPEENLNDPRKDRPPGSCSAELTSLLHKDVPVFYSVPNSKDSESASNAHREFRNKAWAEYHTEIELQRMRVIYTAKYTNEKKRYEPNEPPGLVDLLDRHKKAISAMPPPKWSLDYDCERHRKAVTAEVDQAVAEIQAWPKLPPALTMPKPVVPPRLPANAFRPASAAPSLVPTRAASGLVPAPAASGRVSAPASQPSYLPAASSLVPAPAAPSPVPAPASDPDKRGRPADSGDPVPAPASKRPLVGSTSMALDSTGAPPPPRP